MNVVARDLKPEDIPKINGIHERNPYTGIPGLNYMIVNAVFENVDDNRIVGYGVVKVFAEAHLILDHSLPKRERARAFTEAMQTAILYARDAGVETLYANSNDEDFTRVLENRYKFIKVPGTLLFLDLTSKFEEK